MIKNLFTSFFTRITNIPIKNEPSFTVTNEASRKMSIEIVDVSYEDYMKYSSQQPRRKPARLTFN